MGSLSFVNPNKAKRVFGGRVGQAEYQDEDGVPILISVYLDQDGDLFELDVWKVNYARVENIILDRFVAEVGFQRLYGLDGKRASQESCQRLKKEFPDLSIAWLIAAMSEFPLAGCNFFMESIHFDMNWMDIETMIKEAKEFYPGISAIRHNYFPVGTCMYGSGDPYFIDLKGEDKTVVQIPHDSIDSTMQLIKGDVEVIFPKLADLFKHSQSE